MNKLDRLSIKDEPKLKEGEKTMSLLKDSLDKWSDAALFLRFYARYMLSRSTSEDDAVDKITEFQKASKSGDHKKAMELHHALITTSFDKYVSKEVKSQLPFHKYDELESRLRDAVSGRLTDGEIIDFYASFQINVDTILLIKKIIERTKGDEITMIQANQELRIILKDTPEQLMSWILNGRRIIHAPSDMTDKLQISDGLDKTKWSDIVLPLDSFVIELEKPYVYNRTGIHAIAVSKLLSEDEKWVKITLFYDVDGNLNANNNLTRQQRIKIRKIMANNKINPVKESKLLQVLIKKFTDSKQNRSIELVYNQDTHIFEPGQSEDIINARCIVANVCRLLERAGSVKSINKKITEDPDRTGLDDNDTNQSDGNLKLINESMGDVDVDGDIFSIDNKNVHDVSKIVENARNGIPFSIRNIVSPHIRRTHWRTLKNKMIGKTVKVGGQDTLITKNNFVGPPNKTLIPQMRIHSDMFGDSGIVKGSVTKLKDE